MNYFKEEFLPSRIRVFKSLFNTHKWIFGIRRFVFGGVIRFGVNFIEDGTTIEYTIEEHPDGSIILFEEQKNIDFKVLRIPLNLVLNVDTNILKCWVRDEEKLISYPIPYLLPYIFRLIPRMRLL